uniref:Uncharacterized protein n=1 Tax=Vespula pensylvanica TaxID=30213 RepID=A0A834N304_VESPE|nr:hypothetical protein H0235_017052 [Vespula pensylvanica]
MQPCTRLDDDVDSDDDDDDDVDDNDNDDDDDDDDDDSNEDNDEDDVDDVDDVDDEDEDNDEDGIFVVAYLPKDRNPVALLSISHNSSKLRPPMYSPNTSEDTTSSENL